jgi:DNA-binding GntR family transcriptional regulator
MPVGSSLRRPRTKQQFAYQTLRDGIMRCEIAPGERLVIDEVARRLRVSTIPVREALHLLQSEGLVLNVPHVGATVAPITRESIVDVFVLLEGLGTVATRLVAERASPGDVGLLEAMVADMDDALEEARHEDWAALNTQFHLTISALPGLPMLRDMTERVLDRWLRVRRFYFSGVLIHRIEQAQREHREMLQTMRDRDLERLRTVVQKHNQGALESYLSYLDASGGGVPAAPARVTDLIS